MTGGADVSESIRFLRPLRTETKSAHWVSGDYKAATDSIFRDVMVSALHGIKDPMLANLLVDNLSNGEIHYKDICTRLRIKQVKSCIQRRGQLMGSIFSFPILCVINLATYIATDRKSVV